MSQNRIDQKFKKLCAQKKKALIAFITAGDPHLKKTAELVTAFEKEGVDFVELGVPFSDPLADGPVIQAASQRALRSGTTLSKILKCVQSIRRKSQVPILLMSYLNPILRMGFKEFARRAVSSGVDGVIIPDLPPEEEKELAKILRRCRVHLVFLLAPTSTPERRARIARRAKGFIYYVSVTGVTGAQRAFATSLKKDIAAAKKITSTPVCVGFGISNPAQARAILKSADGVIIGSALVQKLASNSRLSADQFSKKIVRPFVRAVHGGER